MADIDEQLMAAVNANDLDQATQLMDAGADPNFLDLPDGIAIDKLVDNPLKGAKTPEMANLLIDRGADPNMNGTLSIVVFRGPVAVLDVLLRRGGNPNKGYWPSTFPLDEMFSGAFIRAPNGKPRIDAAKIKLLCKYTDDDLVNKIIKEYPQHADVLKECVTHTKAQMVEQVSPAMAGLNKVAKKQYGFETDFPHIQQKISDFAFKGRKDGSGRRKTKKRKYINKTKKLSNSKKRSRK